MGKDYISVISAKEVAKVRVNDVMMVYSENRRVHLYTDEREYRYYDKIENIEDQLDCRFFKALKCCYINMDKVKMMSDEQIIFENGQIFSLGKQNFARARKCYISYLKNDEKSMANDKENQ